MSDEFDLEIRFEGNDAPRPREVHTEETKLPGCVFETEGLCCTQQATCEGQNTCGMTCGPVTECGNTCTPTCTCPTEAHCGPTKPNTACGASCPTQCITNGLGDVGTVPHTCECPYTQNYQC